MIPSMIPGYSGPKTILSVFPLPMKSEPLQHEGQRVYEIAPAKKGSYTTLTVKDTFSWLRNLHTDGTSYYQGPIPATVVAENLVQRWTQGLVGTKDGLGPGIMIIEGAVPTSEEIADATARQEAYFRNLVYEGDECFTKEGGINITDLHRVAAEWMGLNDRPWIKPLTSAALMPGGCPACKEPVKDGAVICKHCHTDIPEFLAKQSAKLGQIPKAPLAVGLTGQIKTKPLNIAIVPEE